MDLCNGHNTRLSCEKKQKKICNDAKVLLLDIEGTTTPISFVTKRLFPYAQSNLSNYFMNNYKSKEVKNALNSLQEQCNADIVAKLCFKKDFAYIDLIKNDQKSVLDSAIEYVLWLMSNDRKVTSLKQLQGNIWKSAYKNGDIKGEVFPDVKPAIEKAKKAGKCVCIYSSGSVAAQKLLFKHSVLGNMLSLIDSHFDTTIGDKKVCSSYSKIAEKLKVKSNDILFLTDIASEADAALSAGCNVFVVCRPGNKLIPNLHDYHTINDFSVLSKCFS